MSRSEGHASNVLDWLYSDLGRHHTLLSGTSVRSDEMSDTLFAFNLMEWKTLLS